MWVAVMFDNVGSFLKSWGTLTVAMIALMQPWLLALYRKFFRQAHFDIYETGNIEIGFSNFGPTIGLLGALRGVNRDSFVRGIALILTHYKDKALHNFPWGLFRSDRILVRSRSDTTLQLCSGFMLTQNSPFPYKIQFWDRDAQDEIRPLIERLTSAWTEAFKDAGGRQLVNQTLILLALVRNFRVRNRISIKLFPQRASILKRFEALDDCAIGSPADIVSR